MSLKKLIYAKWLTRKQLVTPDVLHEVYNWSEEEYLANTQKKKAKYGTCKVLLSGKYPLLNESPHKFKTKSI